MSSGVDDVIVGAALVGKALAVAVHLQEGLGAGVVLTDGTRESLAAKGSVAVHIAAIHAGGHDAAVKQHGSGFLVQIGTGPHCSPDAVALIGGRVGACGGDGGAQGIQLLHHVGVAGEAAAGQQHALVGVVADEVVILGALGDDAGNAAIAVLFQLGQTGLEVHIVAQLLNVLKQQLVPGGTTGAIIGILDLGVHIIGVVLGVFCRPFGLVAVGVDHLHAVLVLHDGADKFDHLGRLVDPGLDHALVALAGGVTGDLAQQLGTIHLDALFLSAKAVHGTHPVTGILHIAVLLDDTEVQALGSGISSSEHTAVAGTHDEDVGVHGLGDGSLVDVRLLAQPIGLVTGGQLNGSYSCLSLCLCKAALGGLLHGIGGDGRAGHAVDLVRAGVQQLVLQLLGSSSAVGSGLAGGIDHNVGHSAVREGHGDLDGRGNALGSAGVGTGGVAACYTGGSGGGGACSVAGSQCTGGDTGHGSGSGDLQKAFTRDLVHAWMILSSLFLFLFFDFPLIRNAPPQYGADFVR